MIRLPRPLRARPSRAVRTRQLKLARAIDLTWSHLGVSYRVTPWPEARFERLGEGKRWSPVNVSDEALASAAVALTRTAWQRFLEFVPAGERVFLESYGFGRIHALRVLLACPALRDELVETPALLSFVAAHPDLRGTDEPRWTEIAAVHERAGVFGLLEWLGLPATRDTLAALRNLVDPDVPRRLLEPLRASLWDPATVAQLRELPAVSGRQLALVCHPLAA